MTPRARKIFIGELSIQQLQAEPRGIAQMLRDFSGFANAGDTHPPKQLMHKTIMSILQN